MPEANKKSITLTANTDAPIRVQATTSMLRIETFGDFGGGTLSLYKVGGFDDTNDVTANNVELVDTVTAAGVGANGISYNTGVLSRHLITFTDSISPDMVLDVWSAENDNA